MRFCSRVGWSVDLEVTRRRGECSSPEALRGIGDKSDTKERILSRPKNDGN